MKIEELKRLTKAELYKLAREKQVKGRTNMSREDLIRALSKYSLDEGQTHIEAEIFDLGTPVINSLPPAEQKTFSSSSSLGTSEAIISVEKHEVSYKPDDKKVAKCPYFDGDPLPYGYNENRIMLMPKNPNWAYIYWELSEEKINDLSNSYSNASRDMIFTLRVYDVTYKMFDGNNANSSFDVMIPQGAREWFIGNLNANSSYVVDLGFVEPNGEFITILRSNSINTPSDSLSNNIDEEWMIVEEYFKKILERSSAGRIVDGKWIGGMGASGGILGSSEEMAGLILKRIFLEKGAKREKLLARLEHTFGSITSGSISAGSLSLGKKALEGEISVEDDFWLKVNTELILYGETEKDADVKVMGKKIKLNSDGTFSIRIALPNGNYELPVEAESKNKKHQRKIVPVVDRNEK